MTSPTRSSSPKYRFEDLTLDLGQRRLWRGSDALPLTNLTFKLLRVLVEAAPNVVSHDELAEKVWGPRRVVTPESLSQRVMVLRNALGDSADRPRYIEGLRGQGYRLIPEVQATSTSAVTNHMSSGDSMMPPGQNLRVPRAQHFLGRSLVYSVAGAFLLAAAFIALDYLRETATPDAATASSAPSASERMIRFVVHAPEGSAFGMAPADPSPALSPDGKQFAFVAPFESNNVLWTQTVGNPDDARPLIGTNGADYPFWSPDGRYIAFHAQGRLKRIAATGDGSPRNITVADLPAIQGGTWSADGTIVFAGSEGLYRIPSEGGEAKLLTRIDHTRGELSYRFPVMLPDETRFVYLVLSTQDEYGGLYLGSIDDPDSKIRLMPGDSNAAFGFDSNGRLHLFFVRDSALVAQAFDASRGALSGDLAVIASEIVTAPTPRYAAFAASGRTLIYRPRFTPSTRLVWIDRHGIVGQQLGVEAKRWRFPTLSPDGTRLVALREDRSDTSGLWLFDLARGKHERLASGSLVNEPSGGASMSAWTPDSSQVVYSWQQPTSWSLYRRPVTGAAERLFAGPTPVVKRVRDVTDDFVVFHDENNEFWVLPLMGERQPYQLPVEGDKNHGRVSPDGAWLAYDLTDAGVTEVYVTTFPEPTERWPISTGGGSDPQWRRDGRELYYVAGDQTLMAVGVETEPTFAGGTPEPLFRVLFDGSSLAFGSAFAPSPDGQRFLVAEAIGDDEPRLIATLNWMPQLQALD
jgi:DNA-binding winged helix-turn-helix (wHTH) protein/Tol biopolymer transport system component